MRIASVAALAVVAVFSTFGGMLGSWVRAPWETAEAKPAKKPKVVTAQEFRLTDLNGKIRGSFVMDSGGQPRLDLYGTDGKLRTSVFLADGEHPVVALSDVYGSASALQTRITLGTSDGGNPHIRLSDTNLVVRADLQVLEAGIPNLNASGAMLSFHDLQGRERCSLRGAGDGFSDLQFKDSEGTIRAQLASDPAIGSRLDLYGAAPLPSDRTYAKLNAGISPDGPRLDLYDGTLAPVNIGEYRIVLGQGATGRASWDDGKLDEYRFSIYDDLDGTGPHDVVDRVTWR